MGSITFMKVHEHRLSKSLVVLLQSKLHIYNVVEINESFEQTLFTPKACQKMLRTGSLKTPFGDK